MGLLSVVLLAFLGLFVSSPPRCVHAFNVDTKHYTVYHGEERSMFGFAVSAYRDSSGRGWAIVGAPEAETTQPNVYRGGAVYKCDIAVDNRCNVIHFDDEGNNHVKSTFPENSYTQVDNKTLQWFGATVSASRKDGGPILACAPRYIWFPMLQGRYDSNDYKESSVLTSRRDPVGTCWVVNNDFTDSKEYAPCRTRHWGYHRQGSCQAGLGAAISEKGDRVFIGAPGSWFWQGQAFSQLLDSRSKVMFTKEGPASEDDSYMGYSVTAGDFIGNGDSGTAVGVPRGSNLYGKVVLFTSNMTNHKNVTGEQMGAYFGYAIASGDIDCDGLDDLIVGAPMYTVPDNPEMTIETGRIYVVYQGSGPDKFHKRDTRDGESNRGRFGLSLASLGDIDHDGCGDFAVGAPYAGPDGRGAVYIYHGSRSGVLKKHSQVIFAEDLETPVHTFGFSVAGGIDLDDNRYPDLVVGAYESSTAMFFKARPVIKMDAYVTFETQSKLVSLDNKTCILSDGRKVACLRLKACFRYTGDGVHLSHDFNVQYVLDVKKTRNPRMYFLEVESKNTMNQTIKLERDRQFCRTVQVYVVPNIRDKLTPLEAELRMSLYEDQELDNRQRDPRIRPRPVLGATTSRKDSLSIKKNCGLDNVCVPDLQLSVTPNVQQYLLGSGKKLELEVYVYNAGEDAFEATYNVKLPQSIDYIKIERIDKVEVPVQCSAPKQSNNNTLQCDIGNPLPQKQLIHFKVLLQPVTSHNMTPVYDFYMQVNTTNPEESTTNHDNVRHLSIPIWVQIELVVEGQGKDIYYNPDNYTDTNVTTEWQFGPTVLHEYVIRNKGPSDILQGEAFLVWPAQTLAGDELLYLIEQPETTGPIVCESANANYLDLRLDERRRMQMTHDDALDIISNEYRSGSTINVQRGFEILQRQNESNEKTGSNSVGVELNQSVGLNYSESWDGTPSRIFHESSTSSLPFIDFEVKQQEYLRKQQEEELRRRQEEIERRRQEEERIRKTKEEQEELRRRQDAQRQREEYQRQRELEWRRQQQLKINQENRQEEFGVVSGGGRTEVRPGGEIMFSVKNVSSIDELQRMFTSLSKGAGVYDRERKQYVKFMGRIRTSAGKEYIQFQDGSVFPLLDATGGHSYVSESNVPRDSRYLTLEGCLDIDKDGRAFVVLNDGRKFLIQGTYTYTEARTYTVAGGGSYSNERANERDYAKSWQEGNVRSDRRDYESRYSSQFHEESRSEEKQLKSEVYERKQVEGADLTAREPDPNLITSRFRRDSDVMSVEEFKRLEKHHRHPREVEEVYSFDERSTGDYQDPSETLQIPLCENVKCVSLHCILGHLTKDQEITLTARFLVSATTLKKIAFMEKVRVSTQLLARVTKQPLIGKPVNQPVNESVKSHEIFTTIEPAAAPATPNIIPLWVVVLSACAGAIILLLLIYLLHKCGFFKRNRPSDAPERQPLNRNGHFQQGDEHL